MAKANKKQKVDALLKQAAKHGQKVEFKLRGARGCWRAEFTIGVQSFHVCDERTKEEAKWMLKMLKIAFASLLTKTPANDIN